MRHPLSSLILTVLICVLVFVQHDRHIEGSSQTGDSKASKNWFSAARRTSSQSFWKRRPATGQRVLITPTKKLDVRQTPLYTQIFTLNNPVSVIAVASAAAAALALALGIAIPVGSSNLADTRDEAELNEIVSSMDVGGTFLGFTSPLPSNDLPFPVPGASWPDDGCGDASVRFKDGKCYPVLRKGPCESPLHWMTIDPATLSGMCRPRLCGRRRVFVGQDELCHDIDDAMECRGGRRLYYTAYGDPVCDCPEGQFPFPGARDDCVPLFTRGPCPPGQVVTISRLGTLSCSPAECNPGANEDSGLQQLIRYQDGFCYALGSTGPCPSSLIDNKLHNNNFLGYDVFKRQAQCVDVSAPESPYFTSFEEDSLLDSIFDQLYPYYDDYRVRLVQQNLLGKRNGTEIADARQDSNTAGVFQLPGSLLNPCRPGSRNGNNFKCTNPLLPSSRRSNILQAVRSAFSCRGGAVLQATGQCGSRPETASCGPSYQFNAVSGQCRKTL